MSIVAKDRRKAKLTVMKLQENFNEPEERMYPVGLEKDWLYEIPELRKTMTGASWMNFGFDPGFTDGDYKTAVFHFVVK